MLHHVLHRRTSSTKHIFLHRSGCRGGIIMFMKTPLRIALVLGLVLIAAATTVRAEEFRHETFHFGFTLPPGWTRMSVEDLGEINKFAKGRLGTDYQAGFRPVGKGPGTTPYILMQIQTADMSRVTYAEIEKEFGAGVQEGFKDAAQKLSDIASDVRTGQVIVDRKNQRIIMRYNMKVADQNMDGISFGTIGTPGVVFIHCYDLSGNFAAMLPTFTAAANSARFDPGYVFHPSDAPPPDTTSENANNVNTVTPPIDNPAPSSGTAKPSFFSSVGRTALLGAVFGAVGAVVLFLIRKLMKSNESSPPPGSGTH